MQGNSAATTRHPLTIQASPSEAPCPDSGRHDGCSQGLACDKLSTSGNSLNEGDARSGATELREDLV